MNAKTKRNFIVCLAAAFLLAASLFCFNASSAFASDNLVTLETGAYARVEEGKESGIKFRGYVDKTYYDGLIKTYGTANVYAGMILVPTESVPSSGFTFNNLDGSLKNNYKEASGTSKLAVIGDNYTFYVTGINIPEANYATQYSAVSYVKIVSDSEVEDFTSYNGAYYKYADYDAENNARDIHTVAVTGYINLTEDTVKTKLKKYLDPVASIENNDGSISLQSIDGYTSPYQIKQYGDNYYAILNTTELDADASNDVSLSAIKYNGTKQDGFSVTDNDITVALLQSNDVTLSGEDFSLSGKVGTGAGHLVQIGIIDNSYIAFNDYKVGNYLTFEFTGNNMPQMTFFANKINGNMSNYDIKNIEYQFNDPTHSKYDADKLTTMADNKGITLYNGAEGFIGTNYDNRALNTFSIWGPNRIFIKGDSNEKISTNPVSGHFDSALYSYKYATDGEKNCFTQQWLNENPTTEFKYVVGTYLSFDGTVHVEGTLTSKDGSTPYGTFNVSTGLTVAEVESLGSNVIAYGTIKGSANATAYSLVKVEKINRQESYSYMLSGGTISENTVVLNGSATYNHLTQNTFVDKPYIAFGSYTVGKYLEFEFTGNNMPQICFFANKINGNMSNYKGTSIDTIYKTEDDKVTPIDATMAGNTGLLLFNGINHTSDNGKPNSFALWGPNRLLAGTLDNFSVNGSYADLFKNAKWGVSYTAQPADFANTQYYFTQTGLETLSDVELKYIVGTYENTDGKVHVKGTLTSKDGTTTYGTFDVSTGLTVEQAEALGDKVIAYGTIKGAANATTFTFTAPYTPATEA